jgi:membrane-bound ClpP family serine protease
MQMIEGYGLALLLLVIAGAMLLAEVILPTHGILGVFGIGSAVAAIVVTLRQNPWAGLGLTIALAAASPLIWSAALRIWPRTWMGRKIMLPPVQSNPPPPPVCVGAEGIALGDLRPMGVCEFPDGTRVEATSEHGIVESGRAVKVIALVNNRPVVRIT